MARKSGAPDFEWSILFAKASCEADGLPGQARQLPRWIKKNHALNKQCRRRSGRRLGGPLGPGQMGGEGRAWPQHALDGQPAAMAVENVLDQRQAQAGAALGAALGDVDAIEALGQPRQMLGGDARAAVAHRHPRLGLAVESL